MRLMMTQNKGRNMQREQQIKQNVDILVSILLFFQIHCCVDCPPPPPFGATAPIRALAYLHETLRFTLVY
jgi:hypothetical protein